MKNNSFLPKMDREGWKPPPLWKGATCFILGGGPSLASVDLSIIREFRIIGVNNAYGDPIKDPSSGKTLYYEPRPWVDLCWFGDERWFSWHRKDLKRFPGLICTCSPKLHRIDGVLSLRRNEKERWGIDENPRFVRWNGNSGSSAINLAYHLGVKKIILLGFDMKKVDKKNNWHDDHQGDPRKNPFYRFLRSFPIIAADAHRLGLEIINCTIDTSIQDFRIMPLEEALGEI